METGGPKRKKTLKLQEQDWELVRTFVESYFEQSEKATKATYETLFADIKQEHPDFDLHRSEFRKHIGPIEILKEKAGIKAQTDDLSKEYRERLNAIFQQVLIGLPFEKFKSIKFDELIQRAHKHNPDLRINERNSTTIAQRFQIKQLKALARDKRQDPGPFCQSVCAPEAPATAQAPAAAAIDGPRPGGIQGRRDDEDRSQEHAPAKRPRRNWDPFDYDAGSALDPHYDADAGDIMDHPQSAGCQPAAGNGAGVDGAANECGNNKEVNQVQPQASSGDEEGAYNANHRIPCYIWINGNLTIRAQHKLI